VTSVLLRLVPLFFIFFIFFLYITLFFSFFFFSLKIFVLINKKKEVTLKTTFS
jgi:hypothetical protein